MMSVWVRLDKVEKVRLLNGSIGRPQILLELDSGDTVYLDASVFRERSREALRELWRVVEQAGRVLTRALEEEREKEQEAVV